MARRDSLTLDLFEVPQPAAPLPASMNYRSQVSEMVSHLLKVAEGDRFEIAARCARLTGINVSKMMLDAYSSEGRDTFNLPFWLVPALEQACKTHVLTNWLVATRGGRMLLGREVLTAELGKWERQKEEAARVIKELKKMMGESE